MAIKKFFDDAAAVETAGTMTAVGENPELGFHAGGSKRCRKKFTLFHRHSAVLRTVNEQERRRVWADEMDWTGRASFFQMGIKLAAQ